MPGWRTVSQSLAELDEQLAAQARNAAAWRLRLGQALESLTRLELFRQLGFSSLAAYALERCERNSRWVEAARCLAYRLESLPRLRRALATGQLSWSVAELLSSVASTADEAHWLVLAQRHTLRELRQHVLAARRASRATASTAAEATAAEAAVPRAASGPSSGPEELLEEEPCVLTCTVTTEDAWLVQATQTLLEHLGTRGHVAQLEALLAEGQEVLLSALPRGTLQPHAELKVAAGQRRGCEPQPCWQTEAEARCELSLRRSLVQRRSPRLNEVSAQAVAGVASLQGRGARELDDEVRELSGALARRELELARLVLEFHRVSGWRALGYASELQYARERLGLSRSSLLARRALALRLEALPAVAEALGSAQVGVEAALQLVRIATPRTEQAWLARARVRTIKHLREEVAAALMAVRVSGEVDCLPPMATELDAYAELQRAVISGRVCEGAPVRQAANRTRFVPPATGARRAWLVLLASLERWLSGGLMGQVDEGAAQRTATGDAVASASVQTSAQRRALSSGRIVLRWRVSRDVYRWWHALYSQARPRLRPGVSWLRFLCVAFWEAWRHVLGAPAEYGGIYLRDGYCCRSPVCSRRDVTPHHLRFRSQGGGDEPGNVAAVCSWCHLFGIHGGRIRAEGTADGIRWELGPADRPCVVVHGRDRVAA